MYTFYPKLDRRCSPRCVPVRCVLLVKVLLVKSGGAQVRHQPGLGHFDADMPTSAIQSSTRRIHVLLITVGLAGLGRSPNPCPPLL